MLLFDENIPLAVVKYFRKRKNEKVASIIEEKRGVSDYEVLELSASKNAILVTRDKDFGRMIMYEGLANTCKGVILLRTTSVLPLDTITFLEATFQRVDDFTGKIVVVGNKGIRIRRFR